MMVALIPSTNKHEQAGAEGAVIRQNETAKQSNVGKTILDLAGVIAHDFNNLLSPIIGYTEMTINDIPEDSPARRNLEEVLKAASRAQDLVRQFLTCNCHGYNSPKPLELQLVVKEVLKFLKASQPSDIEIREDIDNECGLVLADPTQVHRVIMNLCTNACHAMEGTGGLLEVSLTELHMGPDHSVRLDIDPGPYLCLTVTDNGQGIDRAVIERIFDPFFTTKKEKKGTGLGLFVALGIVRGYAGNITVSSVQGKGTRVNVYLPRFEAEENHLRQFKRMM